MVSYDEFTNVISSLAEDYAEETGEILVSALKAPERIREKRSEFRPVREDRPLRN